MHTISITVNSINQIYKNINIIFTQNVKTILVTPKVTFRFQTLLWAVLNQGFMCLSSTGTTATYTSNGLNEYVVITSQKIKTKAL